MGLLSRYILHIFLTDSQKRQKNIESKEKIRKPQLKKKRARRRSYAPDTTDKTNERGYYTSDERRRYQYMYDVYKERGGNGEIERDFLKLDSLPYEKQ